MRIDVCFVTKDPALEIRGLEHVPVNNLIVETSSPLGLARKRAIERVETEWFAFIDDDITVTPDWFPSLSSHIGPKVGAIEGLAKQVGLGNAWDDNIFRHSARTSGKLRPNQRGYTWNTLMRKSAIEDWSPPYPDLSSWEDYWMSQYVLNKGYDWLLVPVRATHHRTWNKVLTNGIWCGRGLKRKNAHENSDSAIDLAKLCSKLSIAPLIVLVKTRSPRLSIYTGIQNAAVICGLVSA